MWHQDRRIHFPDVATNAELFDIIQKRKGGEKQFTFHTLLLEHDHLFFAYLHTILRLTELSKFGTKLKEIWFPTTPHFIWQR